MFRTTKPSKPLYGDAYKAGDRIVWISNLGDADHGTIIAIIRGQGHMAKAEVLFDDENFIGRVALDHKVMLEDEWFIEQWERELDTKTAVDGVTYAV